MWNSMLFSPDYSDVTFVCPDGIEISAHQMVLVANNPYFQTYFSGPWAELHPDGRWETEKSSNVIKAVLSLIYTGESPFNLSVNLSDAHLLELLETVYEFHLDNDLLRVCQAICMEKISHANVKDLLLSAKRLYAQYLFDACFEYACAHFIDLCLDRSFVTDLLGEGEIWEEIVQSQQSSGNKKKRPRDELSEWHGRTSD